MKRLFSILTFVLFTAVLFSSCEEREFMYGSPDQSATAYVQFVSGSASFEMMKLDASGVAADGIETIDVKVVGPVLDASVTVGFIVDSVVSAAGYNGNEFSFSAQSFTIPTGESYGSVDITLVNANMALETTYSVYISLQTGGLPLMENTTQMQIDLFKKDYCPWMIADFLGEYDVTYESNNSGSVTETWTISQGEGDTLLFDGFWYGGPVAVWGETMVDKVATKVVVDTTDKANPYFSIPLNEGDIPQYLNSSTDGTDVYDYFVVDLNTFTATTDYDWKLKYCDRTLQVHWAAVPSDFSLGYYDYQSIEIDYSSKKIAISNKTGFLFGFNQVK